MSKRTPQAQLIALIMQIPLDQLDQLIAIAKTLVNERKRRELPKRPEVFNKRKQLETVKGGVNVQATPGA